MTRQTDLLVTALAPAVWGSTYYVTTQFLPDGYPLSVAALRALPAGLLLLALSRLPFGVWWLRSLVLGALNFALFWWLLFVAAYRLPGGVAATVLSIQPLLVIFLASGLLGTTLRLGAVVAAVAGMAGVALLVLTSSATLDPVGLIAGLGGAAAMALGTVLTRRWRAPVPLLTFTAWQLTAGGLLLLPAALWFEPALPALSSANLMGFAYLGLIGAALTYLLWFRGIARLAPSVVGSLGFFSPVTAVVLGWVLLDQPLGPLQVTGFLIVLGSVWLSQRAENRAVASGAGVETPVRASA
ncbi:MAG: EamA family transporter [Gammaproteobacteria bacterium]